MINIMCPKCSEKMVINETYEIYKYDCHNCMINNNYYYMTSLFIKKLENKYCINNYIIYFKELNRMFRLSSHKQCTILDDITNMHEIIRVPYMEIDINDTKSSFERIKTKLMKLAVFS